MGIKCMNGINGIVWNEGNIISRMHFFHFQATVQVYPPKPEDQKPMTRLQERLLKKLGSNAYPFKFEVGHMIPMSFYYYINNIEI